MGMRHEFVYCLCVRPAAAGTPGRVLRIRAAHKAVGDLLPLRPRPPLGWGRAVDGLQDVADLVGAARAVGVDGDHTRHLYKLHRGLLQMPPPVIVTCYRHIAQTSFQAMRRQR